MSRCTQWTYNMVYFSTFFIAMKKSIDLELQQKRYTKAYHIICSLCRSTHLEYNTIGFSILWFFCNLLWFFTTDLGGNLTSFRKFREWYRLFHRLRGYVVHPHRWGGNIDFFQNIITLLGTKKREPRTNWNSTQWSTKHLACWFDSQLILV